MQPESKTVVVGMSGGVDSSVAAALLVEQGYRVIGMMLRLWSEAGCEDSNRCCTPDSMAQARRVASLLGIPFYAVDAREPFYEAVVVSFLDGYRQGVTPNPCLVCNKRIRWGMMLEQALDLGADFMATGHYARILSPEGQPVELHRGIDERKDQSYVLSGLNQHQLSRTLLPLGDLRKPEVRELARKWNLPVAEKADSQDLCFLAGNDYRPFLQRHVPEVAQHGEIVDLNGKVVGQHNGLAFYTIGQRKGLGIAAPEPLFVLEKDLVHNRLVVGRRDELGGESLTAGPVNWISGKIPETSFKADVKIRYKAEPKPAMVSPTADGKVRIQFEQPLRDITPGQMAVMYNGDQVIGSGIISLRED